MFTASIFRKRSIAGKAAQWLMASTLLWACIAPAVAQDGSIAILPAVSHPVRVGVAIFLNDVSEINEVAGTYKASFDVRYRWHDPTLAYSVKEVGADRQQFGNEQMVAKLRTIWTPHLTIANQNGSPMRTEGGLFIYADGTVELVQRIKAVLDSKYRLNAFPFDTQALSVRVLSTRYTSNQVALVQDQTDINASGIKEAMAMVGWKSKRLDFEASSSIGWSGESYPALEAKVIIKRLPWDSLFAILTPFLLTLVVPCIMTLYVKTDITPRLTLWGGSILALVALNFTFSVRYPALDSGSLVLQLVTIGFGFQLLMIGLCSTLFNPSVADRWASKILQTEMINFLQWAIPVGFVGLVLTRSMLTAFS